MPSNRTIPAVLLTVSCALVVGACGGPSTVSHGDLEKKMLAELATGKGAKITDVSCPKDIEAKVGALEVCTLKNSIGQTAEYTARVTKVTDDVTSFDFKFSKLVK